MPTRVVGSRTAIFRRYRHRCQPDGVASAVLCDASACMVSLYKLNPSSHRIIIAAHAPAGIPGATGRSANIAVLPSRGYEKCPPEAARRDPPPTELAGTFRHARHFGANEIFIPYALVHRIHDPCKGYLCQQKIAHVRNSLSICFSLIIFRVRRYFSSELSAPRSSDGINGPF